MSSFKKIGKWSKITILSLLLVLAAAYLVIFVLSQQRIQKIYSYTNTEIEIPQDSISIAKGKHLYKIRSCQDCHGEKGEGRVFMNSKMLLQLTAPNLTRGKGGIAADLTTLDWVRVLRHGVDRNGRSLLMMPSHEAAHLTNEDLADLIAYCRNLEPVSSSQEKLHSIGPVGRLLLLMNQVTVLPAEKIDHRAVHAEKLEEKTGITYGKYLSTGCQGCHRTDMRGGGPLAPGFPPVPDITAGGNIRNWNTQSFIATIKTGKTPEGKILNNEYMPWKSISHFTNEELQSIFMYLKQLQARQ
jgi:mono/diheme cytochrome c family protein